MVAFGSCSVNFGSVHVGSRWTAVHGWIDRGGSRLTDLRLIAIRFNSPASWIKKGNVAFVSVANTGRFLHKKQCCSPFSERGKEVSAPCLSFFWEPWGTLRERCGTKKRIPPYFPQEGIPTESNRNPPSATRSARKSLPSKLLRVLFRLITPV